MKHAEEKVDVGPDSGKCIPFTDVVIRYPNPNLKLLTSLVSSHPIFELLKQLGQNPCIVVSMSGLQMFLCAEQNVRDGNAVEVIVDCHQDEEKYACRCDAKRPIHQNLLLMSVAPGSFPLRRGGDDEGETTFKGRNSGVKSGWMVVKTALCKRGMGGRWVFLPEPLVKVLLGTAPLRYAEVIDMCPVYRRCIM